MKKKAMDKDRRIIYIYDYFLICEILNKILYHFREDPTMFNAHFS